MTAVVASSASGITALGISVARTLRRNRKITTTTRTMVISSVTFTSCDRGADGLGAVHQDVDLDGGRNVGLQRRQRFSDIVHGLDDVGAGLLEDDQQDALAALQRRVGVGLARIDPGADLVVLHALACIAQSLTRIGAPF